jgi:hypothetical protein
MRLLPALGLLLMAATVHAQDLPNKAEEANTNDPRNSNVIGSVTQELTSSNAPIPSGTGPTANVQPLPIKPEPPPAYLGQWIGPGEPMGAFSDDLIITDHQVDRKLMWHVEKVGSCAWCGRPMGWKEAALDKKSTSLWTLRYAMVVADIEITHNSPCFQAHACREWNPLLGQTRAQAYGVSGAMTALCWWGTAWVRKGDKVNHVGGSKYWYLIPIIGQASSGLGIISNLANWNKR